MSRGSKMPDDARCVNCLGPLTLSSDHPHVQITTTITVHDSGAVTASNPRGWCGACTAEWDERITTPASGDKENT